MMTPNVAMYILWWMSGISQAFTEETKNVRGSNVSPQNEAEARLLNFLFDKDGYNPLIRPVEDDALHIRVNFSLALSQLINIDEKNQIMKANVWLQLFWWDYQMVWDPTDYGGIQAISIPCDRLWTPDIVLFNNADGNYEVSYKVNAVIYFNGGVTWIPPAIFKSSCSIDVSTFPFDEQNCSMRFGSWTYPADELQLGWRHPSEDRADLNDYLKSGSWDIISCPGFIRIDDHRNKIFVEFDFQLRRKTLFYLVNLIMPCVLISLLTMIVFALPADAGEKITLCISILVTLVVFMLLVSKILPPSLTVPLVSKYLLFTFLMNVLAIFITVIVINRNYRSPRTHRMPKCVHIFFLVVLPRILFLTRPHSNKRSNPVKTSPTIRARTHKRDSVERRNDVTRRIELNVICEHKCRLQTASKPNIPPPPSYNDVTARPTFILTPELFKAVESVRFIIRHMRKEDQFDSVRDDWKYLAIVVDRLLLSLFIITTLVFTCYIFFRAPHIFELVDQDRIISDIMGNPG